MTHIRHITILLLLIGCVSGLFGNAYCLDFNGTDDYVQLNNLSMYQPTTNITVEAWVYPHAAGNWKGILCNLQDNGSRECGYALFCGGVSETNCPVTWWVKTVGGAANDYANMPQATIPLNRWTHLAGTYDAVSAIATLYVNGVAVDTYDMGSNKNIPTHV
jgi:hypothetical protein